MKDVNLSMYEWIFVSLPFLVVMLMYFCIRMMNSSCQNNESARKGPEALLQSEESRIINSAFIQQRNSKKDRNKPISRWRFLTFLFLTYIGSLLWKASIICNNSDSFARNIKGFAEWLKASFPAFAIILIILSIYLLVLIWRWLREIGIDEHWAFAVITIPYALNIISNWLYSAGDMFGWIAYALSGNGAILIVCLALAALPTRDTKIKLTRRFWEIDWGIERKKFLLRFLLPSAILLTFNCYAHDFIDNHLVKHSSNSKTIHLTLHRRSIP